jgi:glycosyltransferase involved in cell wall biosynthesis
MSSSPDPRRGVADEHAAVPAAAEPLGVHLLHVTTVPMTLGFLRGQTGYMQQRGFRVHALSSPGPELGAFAEREGVEVSAVEMSRRITPLRDLLAVGRLVRRLRRIRPAIVHATTPKGGLLGMIAAAVYGAPVRLYHIRGLNLLGATGWKRRLLWAGDWLACRLAHQVLCVSHSVRQEAVKAGVCGPDKIKVLLGGSGNGVDATGRFYPDAEGGSNRRRTRARFGIPDDATVIGFVGRIVRDKGIVELVEAWKELRQAHPELHLLLVGPFEPEDPVPAATEVVLREDPRVHLAGLDWNTPPLYAAMDIVALPSYREGLPNVPLEAAAMRLPVVATRIPGCVDAVADGSTGVLVPPRDAATLGAALSAYVEDPGLRVRHGTAGRTRVLREFRQELMWEAMHQEYSRLLEQRGLRVPEPLPAPSVRKPCVDGVRLGVAGYGSFSEGADEAAT